METKDISLMNLDFSKMKNPEIAGSAFGNSIPEMGNEKLASLKQAIAEIQESVKEREELSRKNFHEGEKIKTEINNFLIENETLGVGDIDPRELLKEKNELRKKKMDISEMQLNEKVGCWRDIAQLKKESREYERELNDKQERATFLNSLMEQ
jgi:hypothetical protein